MTSNAPERTPFLDEITRHLLLVSLTGAGAQLLLLAERGTGTVRVARARSWSTDTAPRDVLTAAGTVYRSAAVQAATTVHLMARDPAASGIEDLARLGLGPIAPVVIHQAEVSGWRALARLGLGILGHDPDDDPEHPEVLAESAATHTRDDRI